MRILIACEKYYPFSLNTLREKNRDLSGGQNTGHERCQRKSNIQAGTQRISWHLLVEVPRKQCRPSKRGWKGALVISAAPWPHVPSVGSCFTLMEGAVGQGFSGPSYHLYLILPRGRAAIYPMVQFWKRALGMYPWALLGSLQTHSLPLLLHHQASKPGSHSWGSLNLKEAGGQDCTVS